MSTQVLTLPVQSSTHTMYEKYGRVVTAVRPVMGILRVCAWCTGALGITCPSCGHAHAQAKFPVACGCGTPVVGFDSLTHGCCDHCKERLRPEA